MEKLVECKRCSGNACYEQPVTENILTWICMGCGFTTSTELTQGSKLVKEAIAEIKQEELKEYMKKMIKTEMGKSQSKQSMMTPLFKLSGIILTELIKNMRWKMRKPRFCFKLSKLVKNG